MSALERMRAAIDELPDVTPTTWRYLRARLPEQRAVLHLALLDMNNAAQVEVFWRDLGRPADPGPAPVDHRGDPAMRYDMALDDYVPDEDYIRWGSDAG